MFSAQIFQENTFLKTKLNFPLTEKCFPLTNFSNGKQTQESLESGFPENTFRKHKHSQKEKHFPGNQTKFFFDWKVFSVDRKVFMLTGKCFSLTGKCFPLTNFPKGKQIQESLENGFPETTFRETNMALASSNAAIISPHMWCLCFFFIIQ